MSRISRSGLVLSALVALLPVALAAQTAEERAVSEVLDELHDAASDADFARYFGLFSADGIFLGTDATEHWTVEEFMAYARPVFDRGLGWTYVPRTRHVYLSPDRDTAWFDELLDNASLGETRGTGVLVLVDGAQAAGAIPVNVDDLGVDAYAFPAHKWLLGPLGMGALYVAPASGARLESTFAGHPTHSSLDADARGLPWPDARRFEWSNLHGPSVVGFARSCGWLSMFVGLGWWHARGAELAGHLADRLRAIEGVELVTPREQMATLVTFRIGGWSAQTAVPELGSRAFAIVRTLPALDAVRASVGAFNTEDELERFVRVVALLAAHTPETLPSRRLTILGVDA
jgi:hypothetical protein